MIRAECEVTLVRVDDGEEGFSPIATVTKTGDTATITITDKNGTTEETVSDGASGISVTSVQTQYYLSTSSQSATGGSWSDTQQEFVSGKYYWTRDKITYSNSTVDYSTPVYAQGLTLANEYALDAKQQSESAARNANSALTQLGIVENVVDVLNWISEHGTYKASTDTSVVAGKYYFTKSGDVYTVVTNPTGNPSTQGYYELDSVDEAVSSYVSSHLALDNSGLWVVNDSNSYKILLSSTGMKVYDESGVLVSTFGENIEFSATRSQRIGGTDNYILFDANDGSISISGSDVNIYTKDEIDDISNATSETIASVSENFDELSGSVDAQATEVATLRGDVIETASDLSNLSTAVSEYLGDNGYIKISGSSLELGKGRFKTIITENKLSFYEDTTEVAHISGQELVIADAQLSNEMRMGNFVWSVKTDGRLILNYSEVQ